MEDDVTDIEADADTDSDSDADTETDTDSATDLDTQTEPPDAGGNLELTLDVSDPDHLIVTVVGLFVEGLDAYNAATCAASWETTPGCVSQTNGSCVATTDVACPTTSPQDCPLTGLVLGQGSCFDGVAAVDQSEGSTGLDALAAAKDGSLYVGSDMTLGPFTATRQTFGDIDNLYVLSDVVPAAPTGVWDLEVKSGEFGALVVEDVISAPLGLEVPPEDVERRWLLHRDRPLSIRWTPGGGGAVVLIVDREGDQRDVRYRLADDGAFLLDSSDLEPAVAEESVQFRLRRELTKVVNVNGHAVRLVVATEVVLHGQLLPDDSAFAATSGTCGASPTILGEGVWFLAPSDPADDLSASNVLDIDVPACPLGVQGEGFIDGSDEFVTVEVPAHTVATLTLTHATETDTSAQRLVVLDGCAPNLCRNAAGSGLTGASKPNEVTAFNAKDDPVAFEVMIESGAANLLGPALLAVEFELFAVDLEDIDYTCDLTPPKVPIGWRYFYPDLDLDSDELPNPACDDDDYPEFFASVSLSGGHLLTVDAGTNGWWPYLRPDGCDGDECFWYGQDGARYYNSGTSPETVTLEFDQPSSIAGTAFQARLDQPFSAYMRSTELPLVSGNELCDDIAELPDGSQINAVVDLYGGGNDWVPGGVCAVAGAPARYDQFFSVTVPPSALTNIRVDAGSFWLMDSCTPTTCPAKNASQFTRYNTTSSAESYVLVVEGYAFQWPVVEVDTFVDFETGDGAETCALAQPLPSTAFVQKDDTQGSFDHVDPAGIQAGGPDLVYAVEVPAGSTLEAKVVPLGDWDPALYLMLNCTTLSASSPVSADSGYGGAPENIAWVNTTGAKTTVHVVVDSWSASVSGPFMLSLDVSAP